MKKLLLAASILFLISGATATTISQETVTVDLASSEVTVDMHVEELTSSRLSYFTSYKINDFHAYSGGQEMDCDVHRTPIESRVNCDTPKDTDFDVKMNYTSSGLVESQQTQKTFQYTQNFIRPTRNYTLRVLLPKGAVLLDGENVSTPVVSPQDAEIGSNGRRISIEWNRPTERSLVGPGETFTAHVLYEELSPQSQYAEIGLIAAFIVLLSGIGFFVYRQMSRENIENIYDELSDDEVDALEVLRESDGELLQKDLVETLDYSKAKVSGIVSDLVEKEIVSKEKQGRSNKLVISKKYRG